MKTPDQIAQHESSYKPDAWKEYAIEELWWWSLVAVAMLSELK